MSKTARSQETKPSRLQRLREQREDLERKINGLEKERIRADAVTGVNLDIQIQDLEGEKDKLDEEIQSLEKQESAKQQVEPSPLVEVEFTNRLYELDTICRPTSPQFILVDGPAKYGKSYLMREVRKRFKESEDWVCVLVDFEADPSLWDSTNSIIKEVNRQITTKKITAKDTIGQINQLSGHLIETSRSVILLLDSIRPLDHQRIEPENRIRTMRWLRDELVPGLASRVHDPTRKFRAVFAGRDTARSWVVGVRYPLILLLLSPFDEKIVEEATRDFVRKTRGALPREGYYSNITRDILEVTGGHPKCMMDILKEMASVSFGMELDPASDDYYFAKEGKRLFRAYVKPIADEVMEGGVDEELRDAFRIISVFRRFIPGTLDVLIDSGEIVGFPDGASLLSRLMSTRLISPPGRNPDGSRRLMYEDKIVRRMLVAQWKFEDRKRYERTNRVAEGIYDAWLREDIQDEYQLIFSTESLYHCLQAISADEEKKEIINKLKDKLSHYLGVLRGRIVDEVTLAMRLKEELLEDWEISDRMRYLVGDDECAEVLGLIDDFVKQRSGEL